MSKTVSGVKHKYLLEGTKILCETWTDENGIIVITDNEGLVVARPFATIVW